MDKKRLENEKDTSGIKGFRRLQNNFTAVFSRIGMTGMRIIAAFIRGIVKSLKFIYSEIAELVRSIFKFIARIVKSTKEPIKERKKIANEMQRNLRRAKRIGKKAYFIELLSSYASLLFGKNGIFYAVVNYALPIVSAALLIGVISYGSGLEYGICVECNGQEIGIIASETEFDTAAQEVQQRISYSEGDEPIEFSPQLSLKIISDNEEFVNASELADQMLAVSDEELTDAYGIYIDGSFIGAVENKTPIENALSDLLLNYETEGNVKDISFKNTIEYQKGIYLSESVMSEDDAIALLTSKKEVTDTYVVQEDDSPLLICLKYNMSIEDLIELNPDIEDNCEAGRIVTVKETESYLPIQYVREMETITFIDYDTIEVETSSLNVGTSEVLVNGEKGEKRSQVEVTYIDGVERARKVLSSEVTKEPVTEQIGIGTYTARPSSTATILNGTGEFSWPVDGGYISDTFLSDRNHKGLDIAAAEGTDIYAAADGVVVAAGWNTGGYGYFVMIDHLNGYQTVYGHCSALYASEGQTVTRGQLIAAVGNTGDSQGNHCHFEVRYLGVCYDPASFINTVF